MPTVTSAVAVPTTLVAVMTYVVGDPGISTLLEPVAGTAPKDVSEPFIGSKLKLVAFVDVQLSVVSHKLPDFFWTRKGLEALSVTVGSGGGGGGEFLGVTGVVAVQLLDVLSGFAPVHTS